MARRYKYFDVFVFIPGREWLHTQLYELGQEEAQQTATDFANKQAPGAWTQVRVYPLPLAKATPNKLVWS